MRQTRNRIHYKVLEYIYKSIQVFMADHRASMSEEDLIVVLRLIDCLSWDSSTPFDEARNLSAFKPAYTQALVEICDMTENVKLIKLAAAVLSNALTARAWPQTETGLRHLNRLMIKFAVFAEAGGQLMQAASRPGCNINKLIE